MASDAGSADDPVTALAAAVRDRRRALGLRQRDLAELAGCSQRFVHMLEAGKVSLRLDKVLDVLGVLGLGLTVAAGRGTVEHSTPARRPS